MTMAERTGRRPEEGQVVPSISAADWRPLEQKTYRCVVRLLSEPEGGFSVTVPALPGVASQGETQEEALANIREALEGVLAVYQEQGRIPWSAESPRTEPGALDRVVIVHV